MTTNQANRRIVLRSRPAGLPKLENFRIEERPIPEIRNGEILLQILYLSLDPYMRGRMTEGPSYAPSVEINGVMEGGTVARVIRSHHADYDPGEIVLSHSGWQSFAVSDGTGLRKLDPSIAPVTTALGVLGMPGFTAWAGLREIGCPKAGETLVVAAASGAVGSAVGQMAKIMGARTVGIAGGAEKCGFVRHELGFDEALDHRDPNFAHNLAAACPGGVDIYFENVGGAIWDAVFPLLNGFARVPVCGVIAQYNSAGRPQDRPDRLAPVLADVLSKSLLIRGFIQREFAALRPMFLDEATRWVLSGQLRYREDIVSGLDNAPAAFIGLLQGHNFGKLIVEVAHGKELPSA